MFVPDMPNVPDQYLPVLVAEARPAAVASASKVMTLGVCRPVPNVPGMTISGEHGISPIANAMHYLWSFDDHFKQMPEEQRREEKLWVYSKLRPKSLFYNSPNMER